MPESGPERIPRETGSDEKPRGLAGKDWREAARAAASAQARALRIRGHRRRPPGITGIVRLPPQDDAAAAAPREEASQ